MRCATIVVVLIVGAYAWAMAFVGAKKAPPLSCPSVCVCPGEKAESKVAHFAHAQLSSCRRAFARVPRFELCATLVGAARQSNAHRKLERRRRRLRRRQLAPLSPRSRQLQPRKRQHATDRLAARPPFARPKRECARRLSIRRSASHHAAARLAYVSWIFIGLTTFGENKA